jgi:hypothetical protein
VVGFRAQAAEVRPHALFADRAEYLFDAEIVRAPGGWHEIILPRVPRALQRELASLMRPFLSEDDLCSLSQMFSQFGYACADPVVRAQLGDIRQAYRHARRPDPFHDVEPSPAPQPGRPNAMRFADPLLAEAKLYGDGLIHMQPRQHRFLRRICSLDQLQMSALAEHALIRLFSDTGITVMRVDDLLAAAVEPMALPW